MDGEEEAEEEEEMDSGLLACCLRDCGFRSKELVFFFSPEVKVKRIRNIGKILFAPSFPLSLSLSLSPIDILPQLVRPTDLLAG